MPNRIQNISSNPNLNIFVSASAGTGKTKILTDRFIRLMLHGTPPQKILCLTFTKAAAAEMKERIMKKLSIWEQMEDDEIRSELGSIGEDVSDSCIEYAKSLNKKFKKMYSDLKITTIHSLCNEIIRRFYINADLKILEGYEAKTFFLSVIKDAINNAFAMNKSELCGHYKAISDYMNSYNIFNIIASILDRIDDSFRPDKRNLYNLHGADLLKSSIDVKYSVISTINKDIENWKNLLKALEGEGAISLKIYEMINLISLEVIDTDDIWNRYIDIFLTKDHNPRQKLVTKNFANNNSDAFYFLTSQQQIAEMFLLSYKKQLNAEINYSLLELVFECKLHLNERKSLNNFLTFNDLISKTLELLKNSPKAPGILYELDYQIDHVLVDEAQDNSKSQWGIIKALTDEFFVGEGARDVKRTIFLVGDIKQSIFGFQGASPEEFNKIYEFFLEKTRDVNMELSKLTMNTSFRSTQGILDLVNKVCMFNPMSIPNDEAEHISYRNGSSIIELCPLIECSDDSNSSIWVLPQYYEEDSPSNKVACYIASRISEWISSGRIIESKDTPVEPKDIMILVKRRGDLVSAIRRHLSGYGIDVIESSKTLLRDHIITQDIMSLVKFTIDDEDDLNLACLLKTPLFDISEEELFELCYNRNGTLFEKCKKSRFYNDLLYIKKIREDMSILEFLMNIFLTQEKIDLFTNRFGSEAYFVISNIIDVVSNFEDRYSRFSYDYFVKWFEESDIQLRSAYLEDVNAVKIMTVHGAKGLQAPIVIIADAASTEYSPYENIFWNGDVPIISIKAEYDDELLKFLKEEKKKNSSLENNRLLYVALTRAEDELYIVGRKVSRLKNSWYDIIGSAI